MASINVEGLILPNKPLSNFQLIEAAKKLNITHFRGVFVRDQLPKKPKAIECGILNTGDSNTSGFHWICWYKNGDEKLSFDSYALPPPVELVDYLKRPVYQWWANHYAIQSRFDLNRDFKQFSDSIWIPKI